MKRKKAEDRLRRSEAYLAEAQRLSHTGFFSAATTAGNSLLVRGASRIWGFDPLQGIPSRERCGTESIRRLTG